jgi:hypothetical protein
MRFRKNKILDSPEALSKVIYTTKTTELETLLKIIEEKITLEGSNENLNNAKRIITTKLYSKNSLSQN